MNATEFASIEDIKSLHHSDETDLYFFGEPDDPDVFTKAEIDPRLVCFVSHKGYPAHPEESPLRHMSGVWYGPCYPPSDNEPLFDHHDNSGRVVWCRLSTKTNPRGGGWFLGIARGEHQSEDIVRFGWKTLWSRLSPPPKDSLPHRYIVNSSLASV